MDVARGVRASEFCLQDTRLSPREVVAVGQQLTATLASVHRRGILHRDLNAANVLIDRKGADRAIEAAIIDLGMVAFEDRFYAVVDERYPTPIEARTRDDGDGLAGLAWTAPEARAGQGWTGKSDVYSLGLLLYRLLTGKLPTRDEGGAVVSPDELVEECPRPLGYAILAALEEDPALRLDAAGLGEALAEVAAELDGEEAPSMAAAVDDELGGASRRATTTVSWSSAPGPRTRGFLGGFAVAMALAVVWLVAREIAPREVPAAVDLRAGDRTAVIEAPPTADAMDHAELDRRGDSISAAASTSMQDDAPPGTPESPAPHPSPSLDVVVAVDPANPSLGSATTSRPSTPRSSGAVLDRIRSRKRELDACLRGAPPVTMRLRISAAGRLLRADLPGASPLVELCVREVIKAIEFPAADRPSAHRLTLRGP